MAKVTVSELVNVMEMRDHIHGKLKNFEIHDNTIRAQKFRRIVQKFQKIPPRTRADRSFSELSPSS